MSAALWRAEDAAVATGGEARGDWVATAVSIDSRSLPAGALFVALQGESRDGHGFVADALARGAAAAVVTHRPEGVPAEAPLLVVVDTMRALEELGRAGRARAEARVVGVTGSVGKTGTKEALRHVLGGFGATYASAASHNNHWGVPLTLANLPPNAAFAVVEMGMNHEGEIRPLTRMARPHAAVVTAIAPAHLEFFSGLEAIAAAKAEIFEGLEPGGAAIVNGDAPHADLLAATAARYAARVIVYGSAAEADPRLVACELEAAGSRVEVTIGGRRLDYTLVAPGRHAVLNSLAVLAVARVLGLDLERAAERLGGVRPGAGRGQSRYVARPGGELTLLDESYNANPASMAAALAVLGAQPGRRIAVLGDMLELGPAGAALHAGLARAVDEAAVDAVFACGPLMRHLFESVPPARRGAWAEDSAALAPIVEAALTPGDVVLVKGSLGSRMRRIVEAIDAGRGGN